MKNIFLFILLSCCIGTLNAQKGNFILSYPISFPMGDLGDYIEKTSFRGITMEFNKRQKPNLDIGIEVSWHVFYQREDKKVYTEETASITGVQYRYTNSVPLLLGAKYYKVSEGSRAKPFGGLGLGTIYVNRSTDFGLYRITNETWQFCIRPELGVTIAMAPGMDILIGAKYYLGFGNDDMDGQSYLSANIGFVFSKF